MTYCSGSGSTLTCKVVLIACYIASLLHRQSTSPHHQPSGKISVANGCVCCLRGSRAPALGAAAAAGQVGARGGPHQWPCSRHVVFWGCGVRNGDLLQCHSLHGSTATALQLAHPVLGKTGGMSDKTSDSACPSLCAVLYPWHTNHFLHKESSVPMQVIHGLYFAWCSGNISRLT